MYKFLIFFLLIQTRLLLCCPQILSARPENTERSKEQAIKHIDSLLMTADNIDYGPEIMLSLSKNAYELSELNGYTYGILHSTYNIARAFFYQSKLQKSYQILDSLLIRLESDSVKVSKVIDYQVTRSKIYSLMAVIFQDLNDYKKSMQYYLKALNLISNTGHDYDIGLIYKGLGGLNLKAGNFDKAEEYFQKAIELSKKSGDQKIKFDILHEKYEHAKNSNDYPHAFYTGIKLLEMAKASGNTYMTAIALKNIGEIYFLLDEYRLAEVYLKTVTNSIYYRQFPNVLSESYSILSSLNYRLNNFKRAELYAEKALELAELTSIISLKANALLELANSQEANNKYTKAIHNLRQHMLYIDSLNNINNTTQLLQLQSKLELDKVLNEKQLIENQLKIKMLESSRKTFFLIGSMVLIILMGWLTKILIRKYQFEKKVNVTLEQQQGLIRAQEIIIQKEKEANLQMELEHKNRELITRAMTLTKIQEEKITLIDDLQEISCKLNKTQNENAPLIEKHLRHLRNNIDTDLWKDFKVYFENVYSNFYVNLEACHPNLSLNERKLCALLALNLNTKEIAAINSREVRSIESARNRLRKKLGLTPETNLSIYLSQF